MDLTYGFVCDGGRRRASSFVGADGSYGKGAGLELCGGVRGYGTGLDVLTYGGAAYRYWRKGKHASEVQTQEGRSGAGH
jgi:hypothetical protein